MNHILTYLQSKGAPTNSVLAAINHYSTMDIKEGGEFLADLQNVIGDRAPLPAFQHEKEIELTYKCLIEIAFKAPNSEFEHNFPMCLEDAHTKAVITLKCMPYLKAEKESTYGANKAPVATKTISVENQDGTKTELKVKQKKGGKKEAAVQIFNKLFKKDDRATSRTAIIESFMKDLEMGKPGATTYFHNIEKGIWK